MPPFFSVIMPAYQRRGTLPRAIASVTAQEDADWEAIVVDDGSTDGTREWLEEQEDPRIKPVILERNLGVNAARNRGVEAATGKWMVLLDSDDELTPDALESMRQAASGTDARWLLGRCVSMTTGRSTVRDERRSGSVTYQEYVNGAVTGEYLPVVEREALREFPFPEDISGGEHLTWLRLAKAGYGPYVADAVWRRYDDAGTDRLTVKRKNLKRLARVFRRDIRMMGMEYLRVAPKRFVGTLARAAGYTLASWIVR